MKLAISSTACMGKTTLVNDFIKEWPEYKKVSNSCQSIIKEKNLNINKNGDENSQRIIRDVYIDNSQMYSRKDNTIYDRSILDNLAYSMWLNYYGKVSDDFIKESIEITSQTLKTFDIIFFIPMSPSYPVNFVESNSIDIDEKYREEIDNIFKAIIADYRKTNRCIFPARDCPAVIEVFGTEKERIELMKLYITKDGNAYGEKDSLIVNPYGHNPLIADPEPEQLPGIIGNGIAAEIYE